MNHAEYSKLIALAAEMVRGTGMPSYFEEDWKFPKRMSGRTRGMVLDQAEKAQDQAREWGIRLKEVADRLRNSATGEQT